MNRRTIATALTRSVIGAAAAANPAQAAPSERAAGVWSTT